MSDEGRLVADRYRIVRKIGSGAMGVVWQAQDEVLHRAVAIKQLLLQPGLDDAEARDARQRTMREGRLAARLHHPNAITVFDVVADQHGRPCLVMEYMRSTSLAEVLKEHKMLAPVEVARIGVQVAAALKEAHAVGIVHRDVKPANILLNGDGLVKITDFGISRANDDVTVTKTGMIAGTPAYLAPEVAIGGNPGPESDIFSLGSTLYAACEGQPPFGLSENTYGLLHAVAAGQINPPRRSGPLASVLAVLLHPDLRRRPNAAEAKELLDAVAKGKTPLGSTDRTAIVSPASAAAAGISNRSYPQNSATSANNSPSNPSTMALRGQRAGGYYDDQPAKASSTTVALAHNPDDYDPGYDEDYRQDDDYREDRRKNYHSPSTPTKSYWWKSPAFLGGITVAALVAVGIWIATTKTGGSSKQPGQPEQVGSFSTATSTPKNPTTSGSSAPPTSTSGKSPSSSPSETSDAGLPNILPIPLPSISKGSTNPPSPTTTTPPPSPTPSDPPSPDPPTVASTP